MNASYGVWRGKQSVSLGHLRKNADRTAPLSLWAEPDGPASLSPLTMRSSSGGEAPDLAIEVVMASDALDSPVSLRRELTMQVIRAERMRSGDARTTSSTLPPVVATPSVASRRAASPRTASRNQAYRRQFASHAVAIDPSWQASNDGVRHWRR